MGQQLGHAATLVGEGDQIEFHLVSEGTAKIARAHDRAKLIARLRKFRGRLPAGFKLRPARGI